MKALTPLRRSRVQTELKSCRFGQELRFLGIVGSTSDVVQELARADAPDGSVVVAESQLEGRGRRGSHWSSPPGCGIYLSALLRELPPPERRGRLSIAAGIAVAEAVEASCGLPARIKWPNDVLVSRSKVAGILVDLQTEGDATHAVIGIGINANTALDDLPRDTPLRAGSLASLAGHPVDRERLFVALLQKLEAALALLEDGGDSEFSERFVARDALRGHGVVLRHGDEVVEGAVLSIDPGSGLVIEGPAGPVTCRPEHSHILSVQWRG